MIVEPRACEKTPGAVRHALERRPDWLQGFTEDFLSAAAEFDQDAMDAAADRWYPPDRAARAESSLSTAQRSAPESLEKKLSSNPYGHGARSNRDNSWSVFFTAGMITCVVSNRHVVVNVIDLLTV